ncbi:hypothetical protein [Rhodopirellula sallentina]|uniref:Signal peptide protein n=1 Tax=Rhodopirellula sallentina SM41 TaxID=1263870 RepID=M5U4Y6_9BACT|nr:hypothetical protein [Rhodopirellula sallentina]EMI56324.1 signal peptide protein [Rhodopirellula sallentina SM41]
MSFRIRRVSLNTFLAATAFLSVSAFSRSVPGEEPLPRGVASAEASDISDWALAGVVWSDANLARKLAVEGMRYAENEQQHEGMKRLVEVSDEAVKSLEAFGWGRVESAESTSRESAEMTDAGSGEIDARLRSFAQNATGVKRFDTETPAGQEDPGLDDERMPSEARIDIDQYRVDDYVDETPQERLNVADAQEDAIEGAIAAANPDAIAGPASDRISDREGWTLSSSLPYSTDSIYDSDDYDHDVDYMVENLRGADSTNDGSSDQGDMDDDIDLEDPAEVVTGEDELANALARGRLKDEVQNASNEKDAASTESYRTMRPSDRIPDSRLQSYASVEEANRFDARWVQFRLDANQVKYSMTDPKSSVQAARVALAQLQASAMVAGRSTKNAELKQILRPIVEVKLAE